MISEGSEHKNSDCDLNSLPNKIFIFQEIAKVEKVVFTMEENSGIKEANGSDSKHQKKFSKIKLIIWISVIISIALIIGLTLGLLPSEKKSRNLSEISRYQELKRTIFTMELIEKVENGQDIVRTETTEVNYYTDLIMSIYEIEENKENKSKTLYHSNILIINMTKLSESASVFLCEVNIYESEEVPSDGEDDEELVIEDASKGKWGNNGINR